MLRSGPREPSGCNPWCCSAHWTARRPSCISWTSMGGRQPRRATDLASIGPACTGYAQRSADHGKKKDQAGIEPLTEGSKAGHYTAELRRHHGNQSLIGERKVLHRSIHRQKKNHPAVKIRMDFFEDEPGNFSLTRKVSPFILKISTRIFTAG